jgi:hypothetical protein
MTTPRVYYTDRHLKGDFNDAKICTDPSSIDWWDFSKGEKLILLSDHKEVVKELETQLDNQRDTYVPTIRECGDKIAELESELAEAKAKLAECLEHLESVIYGEPPDFATKYVAADKFVQSLTKTTTQGAK